MQMAYDLVRCACEVSLGQRGRRVKDELRELDCVIGSIKRQLQRQLETIPVTGSAKMESLARSALVALASI